MGELSFYNTLTRTVEPFRPLDDGGVRMYTCGPTVYNDAHIGNLRTFLFEDLLRRTLIHFGYEVTQVMNLTDVDDKTIAGATAAGQSLDEFTQPYIDAFHRDLETLAVQPAEAYPRATEFIDAMIEMVETLIGKDFAYERDGSVFFSIAADEDYGKLSRIPSDAQQQGDRVADDDYGKDDVRDFVLWKAAKDGEPSWDSPWGPGRPGWHLECSVMGIALLGESFDIHCGGVDNIFPHHENEIAQSESATDKPFVHTWLHSEHLILDKTKMSKSLGNQYTLSDLLDQGHQPRVLRHLLLSVHYRQKLSFSDDAVSQAAAALQRIDEMRFRLEHAPESTETVASLEEAVGEARTTFDDALADDLNASAALAEVFKLVKVVNARIEQGPLAAGDREFVLHWLAEADTVFGTLDPATWNDSAEAADGLSDSDIDALVEARQQARADKDFAEADRLRDQLAAAGVVVEDTPAGPRWKRT